MKIRAADRIAIPLVCVVGAVAVLIERGLQNGLWILGGIAYACSVLMVISALLSSVTLRKMAFDRLELGLALFATTFAIVVFLVARDWFPLAFVSAISVASALVIWGLTRFMNHDPAK